jgi:sec-independent protein translocase protein TatA
MFNIGPAELIVILIIALIVFGPKRLPEIGRTLGRSLQEFRRASNELRRDLDLDLNDQPASTPAERSSPTTPAPGAGAGTATPNGAGDAGAGPAGVG